MKTSTKGTLLNLGEGGPPGESMTPCSESRKEATSPIPFLSPKKISLHELRCFITCMSFLTYLICILFLPIYYLVHVLY